MEIMLLVEKLLDLVVAAVGTEKAKELLSERAVTLANEAADIVERERWPYG